MRHRAPSWPEKGSEGIGRTTASRAARGGNGRHLAAIAGCLLDPSPRLVWRGCSHDQRGESGSEDVVDIICTILKLIILPCRQRRRVALMEPMFRLTRATLWPTIAWIQPLIASGINSCSPRRQRRLANHLAHHSRTLTRRSNSITSC